jgi:hypothetical protein
MSTLNRIVAAFCLPLVLLIASAGTALGVPAITCHCFQERVFDPARPAAADPYLLASLQNRFLGYLYQVPRDELVRLKMSGVANDRLWVALHVARAAARPLAAVLDERAAALSWRELVARLEADPEALGAGFVAALAAGSDEALLARAVIDQALRSRLQAPPDLPATLRSRGASDQEVIAAVVLAAASGGSPADLVRQARLDRSWGALMQLSGWPLPRLDSWLAGILVVSDR